MNRMFLLTAACWLAWPAVAATLSERSGVDAALGVAPTKQDFVQEVALSDMFEIQSSQLASDRLNGPGKDFANDMISDHTKTSDQLSTQAKAANIPVPTAMDATHKKLLDTLSSLDGDAFKKRYFEDQVAAHKDAVALFERYDKGGDNVQLKTWADQTLPTLRNHLEMAQNLDKQSANP